MCAELDISQGGSSPKVSVDNSLPLDQRAVQSQLATQFEDFELGTGTEAPPLVTSLSSHIVSAALSILPITTATSTVSEADECLGFTTIYVPSATVTVTITAAAGLSAWASGHLIECNGFNIMRANASVHSLYSAYKR